MVLLVEKISRSLKFHSRLENHSLNSEALSASLHDFRSKISTFLTQILLKTDPGSEFLSLDWFHKCFELINISHSAFAKFVVGIDYPMNKWGEKSTEEYLNYTLHFLDILNSITSSVSHLGQARISVSHGLTRFMNPSSSPPGLKKFPERYPIKDFKLEKSEIVGIEGAPSSPHKEFVVVEALAILKKTGFLALGSVLSGLSSDAKPYMDIKKFVGGCDDDSFIKGLDSRFRKEMMEMKGVVKEVEEANDTIESVSGAKTIDDKSAEELKRKLEELENSIHGIERQANNLFSEVLATRNKLVDNLRITGKIPQQHKFGSNLFM